MILAVTQATTAIVEQYNRGLANLAQPYGLSASGALSSDSSGTIRTAWNAYNPELTANASTSYTCTSSEQTDNYQFVPNSDQAVPANREFWVRIGNTSKRSYTPPSSYSSTYSDIFSVVGSTANKPIVTVSMEGSGRVKLKLFDVATGLTIQLEQQVVQLPVSIVYSSTYDWYLDFRIKLDELAGFVQVYDASGVLAGEFVGKTLPVGGQADIIGYALHVVAPNFPSNSNNSATRTPTFAVLSDTTTFGMWVLPLNTSAAGDLQEQLQGSYTAYATYLLHTLPAAPVVLEAATGVTKKVTFALESLAAKAVPANYVIDAVAVKSVFTATNPANSALAIKHLIKTNSTEVAVATKRDIVANLPISSNKYQGSGAIFNINPVTQAVWTFAEVTALQVGFQLEG